jgi:2-dehydro-3-deoxyphosphogluconate aldolase / (4S)-4-hydroxy-2-oxoglutarate aldolase
MNLPKIIAIVRLAEYSKAVEVAEALSLGGITCLEFTLTGKGADDAVKAVRKRFPNLLVGLGSIRTQKDVELALECESQFIVTPAFVPEVVKFSTKNNLPIVCGTITPSEMLQATDAGAPFLKVFPARSFGPKYIQDVLAPLPDLKLVPTGGVDASNIKAYLDAGAVSAGVGGKLVDAASVERNDFQSIINSAKELIQAIQ